MEIIKLVELKEKKKHEERWTEPNGPVGNHEADQPCSLSNFQKEKTEKEKWVFEETVAENFPNLIKDMNMNIQEAKQAPNKMYLKEMHHSQTWSFNKERILKASSKKWIVTYKSCISQGVNIQNI